MVDKEALGMGFAQFTVEMHGLKFDDCGELEPLRQKLEELAYKELENFPRSREMMSADVEVELVEHTGVCSRHNE